MRREGQTFTAGCFWCAGRGVVPSCPAATIARIFARRRTVRFRLIPEQLKLVHERFGPKGIFGIVRDETSRAVISTLGAQETRIDNLFGAALRESEERLRKELNPVLGGEGIELTSLLLGPVDLGQTGEVIAATVVEVEDDSDSRAAT